MIWKIREQTLVNGCQRGGKTSATVLSYLPPGAFAASVVPQAPAFGAAAVRGASDEAGPRSRDRRKERRVDAVRGCRRKRGGSDEDSGGGGVGLTHSGIEMEEELRSQLGLRYLGVQYL
ncbi:hypothetical protein GW17_00026565 [Ensete ventricosum]|nr:hypothetical protein GW17_00026565 [Ensete ventricosum]RZS22376.1 hypothetical protein BHM03_00055116 [Ensete ventricosum]